MRKLMGWSAAIGGIFLLAALGFVIYLGADRMVVIADTGSVSSLADFSSAEELPGHELSLQESGEEGTFLRIPMESAIGPENITIENRYVDRQLIMFIRGASGFFYENGQITGYTKPVESASYMAESEGVTLYLQLSELYEYESILEKGYLQVNLYKPAGRYEKVVVLDAEVSSGLNGREKDALYQIEEKCRAALEAEGIRVYSASGSGGEAGMSDKLMLVEQTGAAMYVGLKLDKDEDPERFGSYVCYNSLYFRPWLTNGDFADRVEQELVTAVEGKALGIVETEDEILTELSIPAVIVCPGYVSHETEGKLLLTDAYQERAAEGIRRGILETFEGLE